MRDTRARAMEFAARIPCTVDETQTGDKCGATRAQIAGSGDAKGEASLRRDAF